MYNTTQFSLVSSAEANYLNVTPAPDAVYDEIAVRMLMEDCPAFLLPMQIMELNGNITLRYRLVNATALKYSIDAALTRRQYLRLAIDLLEPFITCRDWFLDYHSICIDPQYILRNKSTGAFLYAYLPADTMRATDEEILSFAESVLTYITISDDSALQLRVINRFRAGSVTLGELYRMFKEEAERGIDGNVSVAGNSSVAATSTSAPPASTTPASTPAAAFGSAPAEQTGNSNTGGSNTAGSNTAVDLLSASGGAPQPQKKGILDFLGITTAPKTDNASAPAAGTPASDTPAQTGTGTAGTTTGAVGGYTPPSQEDNIIEGLFGGSGSQKKPADSRSQTGGASAQNGGILGGLFGNGGGAKPAKEPAQKKSGGFNLFGGTKASDPLAGLNVQGNQTPAQTPVQTPAQTPAQTPIQTPMQGFGGDTPTFMGGDRTTLDMDVGFGNEKYLELMDTQYGDCPAKVSLSFEKAFLEIGRVSRDGTRPDMAFPETYTGVSRRHARITRNPDGSLSLTDLGSAYFTLLNGERLVPNASYPLSDGAVITFVERQPIRYRVHI